MTKTNIKEVLRAAKTFVVFGEPNGDLGSYEPLKATYDDEKEIWEVKCKYTVSDKERIAMLKIDDSSEEIIGFEVLSH